MQVLTTTIKRYFCLTLPICLVGCFLMILFEKLLEVNFGLIPFFIWGCLSAFIAEWASYKLDLFHN